MGFPGGSAGRESTCIVGDLGLIPGLGRTPGEGKGYPLQYSGLENSTDRIVHGFAKSWTRLSNFHFQFLVDNVVLVSGVDFQFCKMKMSGDLFPNNMNILHTTQLYT